MDYMDSPDFTVTSEHMFFFLFSFSLLHFLVVVSVRQIKLTHVGFRAQVKIAYLVSYRIVLSRGLLTLFGIGRPAKAEKINNIHPCDLVSVGLLLTVVQKVYLANKFN